MRLAQLVAQRSTVLVLDGIEPLQYEPGTDLAGQLKDAGLRGFLGEIARSPGRAFVLITTRVRLQDDDLDDGSLSQKQLRVLHPEAACTLLRRRGVQGSEEDLERAAAYLGNHPLALVLAAEYQQTFGDGSASAIRRIPLLHPELELGKQAMAIMAAYQRSLQLEGEPLDAQLLSVMGLFDRSVELEWLDALRHPPAIPGVTEELVQASDQELWQSISRLRQWGLMIGAELGGTRFLDTHPLIREFFGDQLRETAPRAWRLAHQRLFEHLAATSDPFPETLRAMEPLLLAFVHGCKAGLPEAALRDLYVPRIQRGDEGFATNVLGAGSAILATLAHCFDRGRWGAFPVEEEAPAPLTRQSKLMVLTEAGQQLATVRSYASRETERCYVEARKLSEELDDRPRQLRVLYGLWLVQVFRAQSRPALDFAYRILEATEDLGAPFLLPAARRAISSTHYYRGEFADTFEHSGHGLQACSAATVPDSQRHLVADPIVFLIAYRGLSTWHTGQHARGLRLVDRAVERAARQGLAHSHAASLWISAVARQWDDDPAGTLAMAEESARISGEKGFHIWGKGSQILTAWARARLGHDPAACAAAIEPIINTWGNNGEVLLKPYWLLLLAEVRELAGQDREVLELIDEACRLAADTSEHWVDAPLRRVGARVQRGAPARALLEEARAIAERQGSQPTLERIDADLVVLDA